MLENIKTRLAQVVERHIMAVFMALIIAMSNVGIGIKPAEAVVGAGFSVSAADLTIILKQIKIAEFHVANTTSATGLCGALRGNGPNQVPSPLLPFGLRTVDGSCNNLNTGGATYGASSQPFPRLSTADFSTPGESPGPATYAATSGAVYDSQPRISSNLIVDQTSTNPSAVKVAENPLRTQADPDRVISCTTPPINRPGCVPEFETLFIPNITTDIGLSPPFNSLFTIFGQFFDHGLDKITATGVNGRVIVPLKADDPLIPGGPDRTVNDLNPGSTIPGKKCKSANNPADCDETADNLSPDRQFIPLTRGDIVNDPVIGRTAKNTDTPFVDQNQTYTSHKAHQVYMREYTLVDHDNDAATPTRPRATGKFVSTASGGLATWQMTKNQARAVLGLELVDRDVHDIPEVLADVYGNFIPGPERGMPQYLVCASATRPCPAADISTVEGNLATPVETPANVIRIGIAFLNDIANGADPISRTGTPLQPENNGAAGTNLGTPPAAGFYDNELLDQHYICGDGRCNENIGLTAVHQIFHMEHDRLVDDIKATLALPANAALNTSFRAVNLAEGPNKTFAFEERLFHAARFVTEMEYQHLVFEEFARKVQPLIVPFNPAAFNQLTNDPAITAEFAHAVYRFGHSMLTETLPRKFLNSTGGVVGSDETTLLAGFLNPAAFNKGLGGASIDDRQATGALIMGLSDQTGNEIDEFVTDTLRNNLLGLPLDLATINMTRARSEGVASLNKFRREVFAKTNDGQLRPYASWVDFGLGIKHPSSLENFVAAYGMHPAIKAATTNQAKRTAADQIVNGTVLPGPDGIKGDRTPTTGPTACTALNVPDGCNEGLDDIDPPADAADFMFGTNFPGAAAFTKPGLDDIIGTDCGTPAASAECADNISVPAAPPKDWRNIAGTTQTGVDDIDLWMGGLAEKTNPFGGLLGNTFNYVFETQLTNLQNSDRFYYLARTLGMNLLAQLEGNSFSELVFRNTAPYTRTLKADPFATSDCKFELGNLTSPATASAANQITGPGSVADDPESECNENALLIRLPDGTYQYRPRNSVDPAGINGQSVYNGTNLADFIYGGNDNDTFWGGLGNDKIEGGAGDDVALGGEGNDIITDEFGADFIKGGPGNDAIDGGPGDDVIVAGEGKDFTNGGLNINETFSGPGDDFAIAGKGTDEVVAGDGDDWIEGDDEIDLLIGDSSTFFFDDRNEPGHDILIGQGGDDDYDMEGGDDIAVAGPGVEKNAGAAGFDWNISLGDPDPMNADLNLPIVNNPPLGETKDRFDEIEAVSGWDKNDTIRGNDVRHSLVGGAGFIGCNALDQAGLDRITGLDPLVPPLDAANATPLATVVANSFTNFCLLSGPFVWGEGNILLGGAGNDTIEGRGANDIIDGDKYLNVRLSVRAGVDGNGLATGAEIASTGSMNSTAVTGSFYTDAPANTRLQAAVFDGRVNPGQIVAVREILPPPDAPAVPANCGTVTPQNPANCDVAVFSGPENEYAITANANSSLTVRDRADPVNAAPIAPAVPRITDGIDTLWNMEQLSFCPEPSAVNRGECNLPGAADTEPGGQPRTVISVPPVAVITPAGPLAFGSQLVAVPAVPRTVTITNTGLANLVVGTVSLTGAQTSSYTVGVNCNNVSLARNASCTFNVRFTPVVNANNASLVIPHNAGGSPATITLSGTGVVASGNVTPPAVNFGNQPIGTAASTPTAVTLRNPGTVALPITSIALAGANFARVTTPPPPPPLPAECGTSLAAGASCTVRVRFSPTGTGGVRNGTLTFNVTGLSPIVVPLSGNASVTANNDLSPLTAATSARTQVINQVVRANDVPANAGTVTIVSGVTRVGATATGAATVANNNQITWTLATNANGGSARRAAKRGTYTVTYRLTNGEATATATATLRVN